MASVAYSTPGRKLPVRVIASPSVVVPIRKEHGIYPYCLVLGKAGRDSRFCLKTRLLLALQQEHGASFTDWTQPLTAKTLAHTFGCTVRTMRNALAALLEGGYIVRHSVPCPEGRGGTYQYRLAVPRPGWRGIGDL